MRFRFLLLSVFAFVVLPADAAERPLVLYTFGGTNGEEIADLSGFGESLPLIISDKDSVRRSEGEIEFIGDGMVRSGKPATKISDAVSRSGEISVEVWLRPGRKDQSGPARIVTLSKDSSNRNFTLGQEGDHFDVRMRTTSTSENGLPSLASSKGELGDGWHHVVYVMQRGGKAKLYINGIPSGESQIGGGLDNWNLGYELALGNEHSGNRAWRGAFRKLAIYDRALSEREIKKDFEAGSDTSDMVAASIPEAPDPNEQRFHDGIAPLLAKHCLECHDSANQKGDLDLSKRTAAVESETVVPGKSDESDLYLSVLDDEMPHKRDPLSDVEKELLKTWIDAGAHWPVDEVDPLAHKRDRRAAQNWVRRLTVPEYIATIKAATGIDISKEAQEMLPRDLRADGFSNTAYNLGVDLKHIESYARLASIVVSRMDAGTFAKRFAENRQFTDKSIEKLLKPMGKWLLRGPLEKHEIIAYRGISTAVAAAGGTFDEAVGLMIESMLQSPRFIYQIETQRGDGGQRSLDNYQLASRMSYIIWGSPPDEKLARAADNGELYGDKVVGKQIGRMLKDPRAVGRSLEFIGDWLHLGRLENLAPNNERFPNWTPEIAEDMRTETLAYFEELVWQQKRPLYELLNAQFTVATPRLAEHYRLASFSGTDEPAKTAKIDLTSDASRGGILTHGSVLTMGGDSASMVTRGLFVLHDLLRSGVNDPPPGTDTTPVPSEPGLPQRKIAEMRVHDKSCGGCHSKFEPLAYGLERYDGLGSYSEIDRFGNTLREDGSILFPGEAKSTPYKSASELMDLLAGSDRVRETLTWKVVQFALGRPLTSNDVPHVKKIHDTAMQNRGTYQDIITALVQSELVQTTKTEAG